MTPKVLIAAPMASAKDYSIGVWLDWISKNTYSNFDVAICANGKDEDIQDLLVNFTKTEITTVTGHKPHIIPLVMPKSHECTVIQRLCYSRNVIMEFAVKHDYDYVFFLDSDTIPRFKDTIQVLMDCEKDYVSGTYMYKQSKVPIAIDPDTLVNFTMDKLKDLIINKKLVKTLGTGYGCVLLSKKAFSIPINYERWGERRSDDFNHAKELLDAGIELFYYPFVSAFHLDKEMSQLDRVSIEKQA